MGGKSSLPVEWLAQEKQQLHDRWVAGSEIHSRRILEAFLEVPREHFVPLAMQAESYVDYPLPIGAGQTISQPTTVMLMLDLLNPQSGDRVLEIGAGSGYNAALLACLTKEVITVERHDELAKQAETALQRGRPGTRTVRPHHYHRCRSRCAAASACSTCPRRHARCSRG
jgi:protein-L-isoaspartate(D-aspartate) O-methyltransferase